MAAMTPKVLLASALGIALSATFTSAGYITTFQGLPVLLLPAPSNSANAADLQKPKPATTSSHLARQWQLTYDQGVSTFPKVAAVAASAFLYSAWVLPKADIVPKRLFVAAAILNLAVGPFTLIAMKRTNAELTRRAKLATDGHDEDDSARVTRKPGVERYPTPELLEWWGSLNAMRGTLTLTAIGVASTALAL